MTGIILGGGGGSGVNASNTTAIPENVRSGKVFLLADGSESVGTMPEKAAAVLTPSSTEDGVIASGQYLTGAQTLPKDANFTEANIAKGKTMYGKTGTYTSDATARADEIKSGETAYVNGVKLTGTMSELSIAKYTVSVTESAGVLGGSINVGNNFIPVAIIGAGTTIMDYYANSTTNGVLMFQFSDANGLFSGDTSSRCLYFDDGNDRVMDDYDPIVLHSIDVSNGILTFDIRSDGTREICEDTFEITFIGTE